MPPACCVLMCGHSRKECKMKKFPSDPNRAAVWENNMGRPDWKRPESANICECHFDKTQFEPCRQDGKKKLRSDAVPLIFPTHVLVVHDPSGQNKWHTPEPKSQLGPSRKQLEPSRKQLEPPPKQLEPPPEQLEPPPEQLEPSSKQRKLSNPVKIMYPTSGSDHLYAKDSAEDDILDDSVICDNFSEDEVLDELRKGALSPLGSNKMTKKIQSGSIKKSTANLSTQKKIETCKRSDSLTMPQKPSESQMKVLKPQSTKTDPILKKPGRSEETQTPPKLSKRPDAYIKMQTRQSTLQKTSQASMKISEPPSEDNDVELFDSPEVLDTTDVNGSALESSGLLKDALNFLQFMLPRKWIAFSENCGIHVALHSKSKAKSIQRSIFVPFNGDKIELYVHAEKLSKNHEIFDDVIFNETEALTEDSLGSVVDRIVNIVQLFSSYEICCGATEREFLIVWRQLTDSMLDLNAFGEERYHQTVRSISCLMLVPKDSVRCKMCDALYE